MIRLGLRLALSGGRERAIGLALTAFAVAVGTPILLFALSFLPALDDRAARAAWRRASRSTQTGTAEDGAACSSARTSTFMPGQLIVRVLVAGLIGCAADPARRRRVPVPGEAVVSPALAALWSMCARRRMGDLPPRPRHYPIPQSDRMQDSRERR